jgi:hypothetical protein
MSIIAWKFHRHIRNSERYWREIGDVTWPAYIATHAAGVGRLAARGVGG